MGDIPQTNAGVLAKKLRALGVRYAFGIPSGEILAVIEVIVDGSRYAELLYE